MWSVRDLNRRLPHIFPWGMPSERSLLARRKSRPAENRRLPRIFPRGMPSERSLLARRKSRRIEDQADENPSIVLPSTRFFL